MKLVIVGATGFVATELLRQCIHDERIKEVVTVSRKEVEVPVELRGEAK